jgi:hypothetical protein
MAALTAASAVVIEFCGGEHWWSDTSRCSSAGTDWHLRPDNQVVRGKAYRLAKDNLFA